MKTLPKVIVRIDDSAEFVLNEETQLYCYKSPVTGRIEDPLFGASYRILMEGDNKGFFRAKYE